MKINHLIWSRVIVTLKDVEVFNEEHVRAHTWGKKAKEKRVSIQLEF